MVLDSLIEDKVFRRGDGIKALCRQSAVCGFQFHHNLER